MLNRIVIFIITFLSFSGVFAVSADATGITVSAHSAVVMNALTGEVIYAKAPYEKRGMASTTKIMTALLAVENDSLEKQYKANSSDVAVEGTSIGLKAGDAVSLEVLVKGMLLESGNDAANVTATILGPGRDNFVALMNNRAKELGMNSTSFKNPSGLTEEGHYSTAYDMAILASEAIKNRTFRDYCGAKSFRVAYGTPTKEVTFYNHNRFLNMYDGALGIKTGFTKASGRCLVTAVQKEGAILVGVTLNAPDDWNDHKKMFDYSFSKLKKVSVNLDCDDISVPVVGGSERIVKAKLASPLQFFATDSFGEYKTEVYLMPFLYAGVNKNDYVGKAVVLDAQGKEIACSYLCAKDSIAPKITEAQKDNIPFVERIIKNIKEGLSKRQA